MSLKLHKEIVDYNSLNIKRNFIHPWACQTRLEKNEFT